MLYTRLFRRALALHLTTTPIRTYSMAVPPSQYNLDRSIFNSTLYTRIREFWFDGIPEGASAPNFELMKRWYGIDRSRDQKDAFDGECRGSFGYALRALSPDRLALPAFESHDEDVEKARDIAEPLLEEVRGVQSQDDGRGAETLHSLILLLDQIPRNIYRDPAGLRLVYNHYDRLAFSLLHARLKSSSNSSLIDHKSMHLRPALQSWLIMPLMHSEHIPSHELYNKITRRWRKESEDAGDQEAVAYLDRALEAEEGHIKLLRRFGRYPHRNKALGRENTPEEVEELKGGDTFGVRQGEEKEREKSEL